MFCIVRIYVQSFKCHMFKFVRLLFPIVSICSNSDDRTISNVPFGEKDVFANENGTDQGSSLERGEDPCSPSGGEESTTSCFLGEPGQLN